MLMPSFFYENHIDHHNTHRYGTIRDGEYLPLGVGSRWQLLGFWLQVPLLPIYIFLRLLLARFRFCIRGCGNGRSNTLRRSSSIFGIGWIFPNRRAPRRAALEVACCLRAGAMLAVVAIGVHSWTRLCSSLPGVDDFGIELLRNMVAHHYRNTGAEMSYLAQLEDSVNITGNAFTELFFPLGLRYHALHHLFPALPYHNLGTAHRRLMAKLPAGSPYHQTVYPSYFSVMRSSGKATNPCLARQLKTRPPLDLQDGAAHLHRRAHRPGGRAGTGRRSLTVMPR